MFRMSRSVTQYTMRHVLCHLKRNALFYLAVILMALALKQHYSLAGTGELQWILGPTAGLVSMLSGKEFTFVSGMGHVCDAGRVIIAPGCAGVNFMLMAFGMAAFAGLHQMRSGRHRLLWLVGSLGAAFALTVGVNALRILLSMHTFQADLFNAGSTWEWVHRLEGVVIYFFFQYLFYSMIRKIIKRYLSAGPGRKPGWGLTLPGRSIKVRQTFLAGLTPCAWYLAITLVVPFLNDAPQKTGGRFYDHAAMVLGLCMLTWVGIVAAQLSGQGVRLLFKRRLPEA